MMADPLALSVLPGYLAVCRLEKDEVIPAWAAAGTFFAITRTAEELSVVCAENQVPAGIRMEGSWRALKVEGPLDFSLTGILAELAVVLARARISLFALSTYDTDYILVRGQDLSQAVAALKAAGHSINQG